MLLSNLTSLLVLSFHHWACPWCVCVCMYFLNVWCWSGAAFLVSLLWYSRALTDLLQVCSLWPSPSLLPQKAFELILALGTKQRRCSLLSDLHLHGAALHSWQCSFPASLFSLCSPWVVAKSCKAELDMEGWLDRLEMEAGRETANAVCDGYDRQPGISGVRNGETAPPKSQAALKEQTMKWKGEMHLKFYRCSCHNVKKLSNSCILWQHKVRIKKWVVKTKKTHENWCFSKVVTSLFLLMPWTEVVVTSVFFSLFHLFLGSFQKLQWVFIQEIISSCNVGWCRYFRSKYY